MSSLSTNNLKLPKGWARKLTPKFIGPFPIRKVLEQGSSYDLELSQELKVRGINSSFHASLLRIHVPNDDWHFLGCQLHQLPGFGAVPNEWAVDRILLHSGQGRDSLFEVKWKSGDVTWLQYTEVNHLEPLKSYLEAMGISKNRNLKKGSGTEPDFDEDVRTAAVYVLMPYRMKAPPKGRISADLCHSGNSVTINSGSRTRRRTATYSATYSPVLRYLPITATLLPML